MLPSAVFDRDRLSEERAPSAGDEWHRDKHVAMPVQWRGPRLA
jgi:hypothetical protein